MPGHPRRSRHSKRGIGRVPRHNYFLNRGQATILILLHFKHRAVDSEQIDDHKLIRDVIINRNIHEIIELISIICQIPPPQQNDLVRDNLVGLLINGKGRIRSIVGDVADDHELICNCESSAKFAAKEDLLELSYVLEG
jgi:hypothetical protein